MQSTSPSTKPITVAITGATGLVGSHLVAELLRDVRYSLRLLVRAEPSGERREGILRQTLERSGCADQMTRVSWHEVSLSNPRALAISLQQVDILFHCAATVSYDPSRDDEIISINTEITSHVAAAALESGVGLLVYVSSIATLGKASKQKNEESKKHTTDKQSIDYKQPTECELITEKDRLTSLCDRSAYSISKFYAENAVAAIAVRGLRTIIVHPAIILGEGDWKQGSGQLIALGMKHLVCCTPGIKGYVDVRDVARAMVLLSAHPAAVGERFILCSANLSFGELFTAISRSAGRRALYIHLGTKSLQIASRLESAWCRLMDRTPTLTASVRANATTRSLYEGRKITQTLNFAYTPINETITRIAKAYTHAEKQHTSCQK